MLQADIRLYFPSIDHRILRAQLAERIACPSTLRLLDQILANGAEAGPAIDSFAGDTLLTPLEHPRGLPIGNLTSQFLANFHLDRLDHTMALLPGIGAYLRYVDDMALFAQHREDLTSARQTIEAELAALRLRLHPSKSQLRRCRDGASFVGFHVLPGRIRVRNHNLLRGTPTAADVEAWCGYREDFFEVRPSQHPQLECPPRPWPYLAPAPPPVCRHAPSPQAYRDDGQVVQLLRGGSWINDPHNCRAAYRNSNHPDNVNTNIGVRPCCLLPPAPFTVRAVGRDSSGSTRRVQTRSSDRQRFCPPIRTALEDCATGLALAAWFSFSSDLPFITVCSTPGTRSGVIVFPTQKRRLLGSLTLQPRYGEKVASGLDAPARSPP